MSTGCSSPSAIFRTLKCSKASWISIRMDTCSRRAARAQTFPACSMQATCRIASTARPSRPRARAAWPPSKPSACWKPRDTDLTKRDVIERLSPPGVPAPRGPYSPAVRAGDFILVSGQVPVHPATDHVELGDIQHETRVALNNVKLVLEGAGATLADVVRVGVYLGDSKDFAAMNE